MPQAAYSFGVLKHKPPEFVFFDPTAEETQPVLIKEVKLPHAAETHEVCYEPVTKCVFLSQMSNSVLVRIPVGTDGLLADNQDAWRVGEVDEQSGNGSACLASDLPVVPDRRAATPPTSLTSPESKRILSSRTDAYTSSADMRRPRHPAAPQSPACTTSPSRPRSRVTCGSRCSLPTP